ncbi:hypothetical protein ERY430_40566 [Erythrobacter sp. EC-HK427]|nr:hypothetical protein ERY430_40566 [Erythrobacter sp. EC-HK427]
MPVRRTLGVRSRQELSLNPSLWDGGFVPESRHLPGFATVTAPKRKLRGDEWQTLGRKTVTTFALNKAGKGTACSLES